MIDLNIVVALSVVGIVLLTYYLCKLPGQARREHERNTAQRSNADDLH